MQAQKISHFYPNLFISLTHILASGSTEVKQEEESGSAAKNLKLILLENLELLGYPALVRQGSLRVRTKGKLHFQLIKFLYRLEEP